MRISNLNHPFLSKYVEHGYVCFSSRDFSIFPRCRGSNGYTKYPDVVQLSSAVSSFVTSGACSLLQSLTFCVKSNLGPLTIDRWKGEQVAAKMALWRVLWCDSTQAIVPILNNIAAAEIFIRSLHVQEPCHRLLSTFHVDSLIVHRERSWKLCNKSVIKLYMPCQTICTYQTDTVTADINRKHAPYTVNIACYRYTNSTW